MLVSNGLRGVCSCIFIAPFFDVGLRPSPRTLFEKSVAKTLSLGIYDYGHVLPTK
jgi:hypothetical protein